MSPLHNFEWRSEREFNLLFVNREGQERVGPAWTIEVTGLPNGGSMPEKSVDQSDLSRLIDPSTGGFWEMMCFNDWLFNLKKIEIDYPSRKVVIQVDSKFED
ncbi:hypothetical protein KU392_11880 [Advenella alkanexedens]|uniref:Uncharacterized protein n=1 Tax=Advenella alkanexedens TaxID=1481665 RepID=A0ABS6NQM3_9BURK|nr:hypothetical protein [Advenella alkanexedens]MBV4397943.1 hypothetical protein [Advenella alkanexedens]NLY34753.1 hypothetical protein [Alcaligenaceae bacterium]